MHEWALAESVINAALEYSKKERLEKLSVVGIVFGELQAVDKGIFIFALKELVKNTNIVFQKCRFKIINEPAAFQCKVCSFRFTLKTLKKTAEEAEYIHFIPEMAHAFMKCPRCKSPDFNIVSGRGVYIKYLKGTRC